MATMIASPTATSAAATVMTKNTKIWPSIECELRENATNARFDGVQHQLDRHEDDERVAAHQHADHADREQDRARGADTTASGMTRLIDELPLAPAPTAPTIATSSRIDVISNGNR